MRRQFGRTKKQPAAWYNHSHKANETTLTEVGEMLTHVVEHMATKEDVARLDTRIDDLRTEMIDQFEHADTQFPLSS